MTDAARLEGFGAALSSDELNDFMSRGVRRTFRRGSFLMTEGEASDHVIVLLTGRAKVSSYTVEGKEVVLAVRGPGDLLGELSAFDGEPRLATVSALEPIEALIVPSERFTAFLEDHPRLAILLLETMTRRLRDSDRKRVEFGAYDTPGRVARRLIELVERYGEEGDGPSVRISLSLTQDELAGWTGSSREAVSKALREFRDRGWVTTGRRSIIVLDVDALRSRSL
ncbi:MAG TPA: Crp/Fnr family transcriptional regulator [Actinomycetota bacterium]|nr:Crp/Fnr family transcriptional regulator [Actinomycetota bacterium]